MGAKNASANLYLWNIVSQSRAGLQALSASRTQRSYADSGGYGQTGHVGVQNFEPLRSLLKLHAKPQSRKKNRNFAFLASLHEIRALLTSFLR